MKVETLGKALDTLRGAVLLVEDQYCINVRGRTATCTRCADACHVEALTLDTDGVTVADTCTACGACVPACPAGALRLPVFDPRRVADGDLDDGAFHLHCSASTDQGGGTVIPCHRMLDARLASTILAAGATRIVLHGMNRCGTCEKGDATDAIAKTCRRIAKWFGDAAPAIAPAAPDERGTGPRRHHDQPQASRRNFLRLTGSLQAAVGVAWLLPAAEPSATVPGPVYGLSLPQRPVPYREAVARVAAELPWGTERALPWAPRMFTDACTACQACAVRCPTGALRAETTQDAKTVVLTAALCTSCGLCGTVCPTDAVRPTAAWTVDDVLAPPRALVSRALDTCTRCQQPFDAAAEGAEGYCAGCANERDMDDDWSAMLSG